MLSGVIANYHCYAPTHPPKTAYRTSRVLQGREGSASLRPVWGYRGKVGIAQNGYRKLPYRPSFQVELSRLHGGPVWTGKVLLLKRLLAETASCLTDEGCKGLGHLQN